MKNLKNLYIVDSPLQLINAIEAQHYFKTKNNILLITTDLKLSPSNYTQMNKILQLFNWGGVEGNEIIFYDKSSVNKYLRVLKQVKLIYSLKKHNYDYIVSGEYGVFFRVLSSNLNSKNIYLTDDGAATIDLYEKLVSNKYEKLSFKRSMKLLRYKIYGLKTRNKKVDLFTFFDLEKTTKFNIVKNDFTYLKSKIKNLKKSNSVYILGQNLIEPNILKMPEYIKVLQIIKKEYENNSIIYIPHRFEVITNDYDVLKDDNFTIEKSIGPIEFRFIEEEIYPSIVISFFSTALYTISKLYSDTKVISYRFPINKKRLDNEFFNEIEMCYDFYKKYNMEVVSINID